MYNILEVECIPILSMHRRNAVYREDRNLSNYGDIMLKRLLVSSR